MKKVEEDIEGVTVDLQVEDDNDNNDDDVFFQSSMVTIMTITTMKRRWTIGCPIFTLFLN